MVTSDAYKTLSKVLGALRAHDTDTIEALADPRVRSGRETTHNQDQEHDGHDAANVLEDGAGVRVSGAAAGVLRFSEERDPAVLARFVRLRVINPEGAYWRRGVEAAGRWLRETGNTVLRVPYTVVTPEDWGAVGGYPLGQWIADQRRTYTAGTLEAGRVAELEKLGMVWSEQDAAWADGICPPGCPQYDGQLLRATAIDVFQLHTFYAKSGSGGLTR
ncbi:helicase associated domain-containing protein [Streptomyces sp. NPDC057748]|uniref:helicase associated domain-containing protein n=1 Tax=unclassified Streptomyces TaxID=2593676 RepID=UPI0036B4DFF9